VGCEPTAIVVTMLLVDKSITETVFELKLGMYAFLLVFTVGTTVIVDIIGFEVLFKAVKAGMLPMPLVTSPICELLLVQEYMVDVLVGVDVKFTGVVNELLQMV
jgi:hypothetical protein